MLRRFALICFVPLLLAQDQDIRVMLEKSEAAWNRGDLVAFVSDYEDSAETTFVGNEVVHGGREEILGRYRRRYGTRDKMGTLEFSEIAIRNLAPGIALATGKYELKRSVAGGGPAAGRFTLVLRKTPDGWKIIHDHSS